MTARGGRGWPLGVTARRGWPLGVTAQHACYLSVHELLIPVIKLEIFTKKQLENERHLHKKGQVQSNCTREKMYYVQKMLIDDT